MGDDTWNQKFPDYSARLSRMEQKLHGLREKRQKAMEFLQVLGIAFVVLSIGCRIRFHMRVPVWLILIVIIAAIWEIVHYIILTKKIREIEENEYE